jgi:sialic acid synthase SpsE
MSSFIELPNGRKIGPGQPAFIVGEIGQNHNGDAYAALRLTQAAVEAGCDAVKLTKRHIPSDLTKEARDEPYPGPNSFGRTYGKHRCMLELSIDEYAALRNRIRYNNWPITLFATACDRVSLDELENRLDPPLYKVASRDLDNEPLLEAIAATCKPVILSTGMHGLVVLGRALEIIRHRQQVVVLYCISRYPTEDHYVDLRRIDEIRRTYGISVGFSDHTVGIHLAQAAVQAGAVMIEKHITLARAQKGTDHAASLEPEGLKRLVRNIRSAEHSLSGKPMFPSVHEARNKLGRSLVTTRPIAKGERIRNEDLCLKSPGVGMPWGMRDVVIGRRAAADIPADFTLLPGDFRGEE